MSNFGVLIIAYRRPLSLSKLTERLIPTGRPIYVYVDHDENSSIENREVIEFAEKLHASGAIICKFNHRNAGVGQAVPCAIQWALGFEESILVLEDDCELGNHALEYFDKSRKYLSREVMIISGRSAWPDNFKHHLHNQLTFTNFALTNGFLISRDTWKIMSRTLYDQRLELRFLISVLRKPRNILALAYFYSACKVNSKIEMKAWDCFIVFEMLVSNLYSLNPNFSTITTRGIDHVASNTKGDERQVAEYVVKASEFKPSEKLNSHRRALLETNSQISRNIYKCKIQNLLSPVKAWLIIFKYKFL